MPLSIGQIDKIGSIQRTVNEICAMVSVSSLDKTRQDVRRVDMTTFEIRSKKSFTHLTAVNCG